MDGMGRLPAVLDVKKRPDWIGLEIEDEGSPGEQGLWLVL